MNTDPLLSVQDLSLGIHDKPILHGLDFTISRGEIVGVIGESGSGKSLTALAIMQLLPRGSELRGEVVFDGRTLTALDDEAMNDIRGDDIGMVFQEPMTALNPVHSIGDQVSECVRLHSAVSRRESMRQAANTLRRVGLPPERYAMSRYPHELSGGQRQRVGIAMAIAMRPKLLIADEPTTALDVTTQAEILELLRLLSEEDQMALLLVSHDLGVVADMAERVLIMRHGRIVEQGTTQALFKAPQEAYTRRLIKAAAHQPAFIEAEAGREPLLRVEQLVCSYRNKSSGWWSRGEWFNAVDEVSFEIAHGERVGLVGESGCGKSTLTRALLGLEPIRSGAVWFAGEQLDHDTQVTRAVRRRMQVVFQDPYGSFNPRHRVARIVAEPLHVLDDPPRGAERRARVEAMLRRVGLEPSMADRHIHAFSGGQRQRIAIARALILNPELVILDEAVSALDVSVRAQVLDLLAELASHEQLSWLFITHDLSVVRRVTDRILVMRDGRIVEQGATAEIFEAPQQDYTRRLLAAAPVMIEQAVQG